MDLIDKIKKKMDTNKMGAGLFLDIGKAFVCVHHQTNIVYSYTRKLIRNPKHMGIRGVALKWFASYLRGRGSSMFR